METLLARYLDGELSEEEAAALLDAAREDPALEAELRRYEMLLAAAGGLEQRVHPPAGFADAVMERVAEAGAGRGVTARHRLSWRSALSDWRPAALAASLVAFFAAGFLTGQIGSGTPEEGDRNVAAGTGSIDASSVTWVSSVPGREDLRIVRLVYRPSRSGVRQVSVAGSFNRWDPASTPMLREGDLWSVVLVLPSDSYEYMFVEDGERWVEDPRAPQRRDDGFGGTNAVLDLTT